MLGYKGTGVGTGGGGGGASPTRKKGGQDLMWFGPPHFSWFTFLCLALSISFISCHTLGSTALALVCVRGHFRVLENEKFPTLCEGNPSHTLPNSVAPLPRMCAPPPTYKYVATPM